MNTNCDVCCNMWQHNTCLCAHPNFFTDGGWRWGFNILCLNLKTVLQNYIISLTTQTAVCNCIYMHVNIIRTSVSITLFKSQCLNFPPGGGGRPGLPPPPPPSLGTHLKMYLKKCELVIRLHTAERLWVSAACLHVSTTNWRVNLRIVTRLPLKYWSLGIAPKLGILRRLISSSRHFKIVHVFVLVNKELQSYSQFRSNKQVYIQV